MIAKPTPDSRTGYSIQYNLKPRTGKDSCQKSNAYGNKATQKRKMAMTIFLPSSFTLIEVYRVY